MSEHSDKDHEAREQPLTEEEQALAELIERLRARTYGERFRDWLDRWARHVRQKMWKGHDYSLTR